MTKKRMWLLIITMALSMIGIGVIQLIWFKSSINQDEKNFNDKVMIALGIVKERLMEDARTTTMVMRKWEQHNKNKSQTDGLTYKQLKSYQKIIRSRKNPMDAQKLNFDLAGAEILINPGAFLEKINKDKLDAYIRHELEQQEIDLDYDYGVYSNKVESFIIMNGHFTAQIGIAENFTPVEIGNELYNSEYRISLFNSPTTLTGDESIQDKVPGYLQLYFPNKSRWLWRSVIPSLLMSILFTGLVLFCFGYVVYIVLRQKQVSEMKTDFINNMTHEFKTPIATISLAADSIGNPKILSDENKVLRFSNIIKQENNRMLSQVEKVLQMAQLDKKDFQLKLSQVDMHDAINKAAELTNLKIKKRNGILHAYLDAKDSIVTADSTHISNIIHNLLDNAVKYSSEEVEIVIKTENQNDNFLIHISDKGIGMTKDQIKNIFEKFYRVHTGNIHNVKGFGLGLSYVKAIVDAHHGSITVKSEPDKGSIFSIAIPHKQNV